MALFGSVGKKLDFDLYLTEKCVGGLRGLKNKIRLYIINQKKISHKLNPLVGCFGNVEESSILSDFDRFRPGGTNGYWRFPPG